MENNIETEKDDTHEFNCQAYFKKYFGSVIKEGEDNEIIKKVTFLKDNIMIKKNELNKKINDETQIFKEKIKLLKIHSDQIVNQLFDMDIINKKKQKKKKKKIMNKSGKKDDKNYAFEKINNMEDDDNEKKEDRLENDFVSSSYTLIKKDENKNIEQNDVHMMLYKNMDNKMNEQRYYSSDVCSEEEFFEEKELYNMKFENLLKKCIDEKKRLENIKRGLIFLKSYPMIKNEINELFLISNNNIKLNIEEKIKNIKLLYKHLIYINENEDIIDYIKNSCCHDISLYTNKFFNDFFLLLNDILSIYIIDNIDIPLNDILKIFVDLYEIYLNFQNKKENNTYSCEFLINELIKKMVHFITINFRKTFFKFVISDEHVLLYNAIINYYEYFITFIEERNDILKNIIVNIISIVYNMEHKNIGTHHGMDVIKEKKIKNNSNMNININIKIKNTDNNNINCDDDFYYENKSVVARQTEDIFNDGDSYNQTYEQEKINQDDNKNLETYNNDNEHIDNNKQNSKNNEYALYDGHSDDIKEYHSNVNRIEKNYKNKKYECNSDVRDNYVDIFFINLFVESIHVVCNYIEGSEMIMNIINESSDMNERNIMQERNVDDNIINDKNINYKKITKKNFIHNIMESLKVSLQTLCNSSFFISKKKIFRNVLKECSFINKNIIDEYLISIINYISFDMNVFENINLKVNHFDRTNFITENKLFLFFSDIQNDIKNIIEKKYNELNNKDIFHSYFFSFVLYFSFIYKHDTEFLLLYINMYNILYEIIYNIKEEIKKKKKSKQLKSVDKNKTYDDINDKCDDKNKIYDYINDKCDNNNYASIQMKEDFYKSNEVCEYIKNIITIFLKSLNILNNIINIYESFGSYLFEKTYATYKSKNVFNIISKCMIEKNENIFNYPNKVDKNICQLHQYFFKDTFAKKSLNNQENKNMKEKNNQQDINQEYSNHITDNDKNKMNNNDNISTNKKITDIFSDLSLNIEDIDTHECGKQLLKSSLCKLNEIKNTIVKNIIHFILIPVYDYINKYINSFISYYKNNQIKDIKENINVNNINININEQENYNDPNEQENHNDPNEYICFIVDTIFVYMEILYEYKSEDLLEQILLHFEEHYVLSIHNLKDINTHILLQIQTDLQYLINIYKKFKNKYYKHFLMLYISISFSLTCTNVTNIQISFQNYINEYITNKCNSTLSNFNINNDDILKATSYVKQLMT
ncbi:conserved Plasmodium protein, unknown function [Plasmodium sp. gorilla clade G2]|uniref:conserved Plasmodium protein, unknown function n=1 Tax=Plasmodium sp. gorilla clade G2 TaxID=880535 RepID=UPI000D214908|nr:conserved Plasmodium protein, unknown function [Plasmodium sp. gorilla clade G2]SOV14156.1 conserved Plasmodium protein, unknown function [Plasmodium sp. gorilla clade G2]